MDQPISCSLEGADATLQLDEWQRLFARIVIGIERPTAENVTMRLAADAESLAALVALAQREAACCPFFRFAVEINSDGASFTVSVPSDAAEILDGFATLVPR